MGMEALSKTYNGLRRWVDQFANTTTDATGASPKVENRSAWYAEWDDNYLGDLLDNALSRSVLRRIADSYYGEQLSGLIDEATRLTPETYPTLHAVYASSCDTLGFYNPPAVFVTGRLKGINALSLNVKGSQSILVSPKVATCLSPNEQSFILGHELGHHQQGNLVCHTVGGLLDNFSRASEVFGPLLLDTIEMPLKRWCRRSEFNADRAGYLCCQDTDAVRNLFLRLGMKFETSTYENFIELETTHPLLATRWKMLNEYLQTFAHSEASNNNL